MKIYDLTLPLSTDLPIWPGDPNIAISLSSSLARGDDANVTRLELSVHAGTHIDAPFHFVPDGPGIDQLSLETLIGPCRLFDMTGLRKSIDRSDLENLDLSGITRILFKTTNSKYWSADDRVFHTDFIYLSTEGAHFLVEHKIKLVGIDYLSIEKFNNAGHPTHHALLRNHVIILEGLNLSAVPEGDYELIALPLKLKGADGAPTRVVLRECSA